MTDAEIMEIMARALFEQQHEIRYGCAGADLWAELDETRRWDLITEQEVAISALTEAGLAIVSVKHVLALRAALIAGDADEAHRQLDAIMLKESQ